MLMRRTLSPFPWWRWVRLPADRRFERHLAEVHAAIAGFIAGARERIAREPARREQPGNLLEAMLVACDDGDAQLSEEEIAGNVLTVLLAGEDTTANTLCWALHLLSRHPAEWDAVVREVDGVLGDDDLPRRLDATRELDAIERAVAEAMRLKPVAPFMLMQNNVPVALDDVALPADTTVVCLMRPSAVPHGDADARLFRPGRSLDAPPDGPSRAFVKASMPFGAGPRLCPGRYLAMIEMKMVIATIARNHALVRVETEDGAEPLERLTFTMAPVGLRMVLGPRPGARTPEKPAVG
jgi:cytochrome P450